MNWLAHLFLSHPQVEDRLGNIIADLVKGKNRKTLNSRFDKGIECHLFIDFFTDHHPVVKHSKKQIILQHKRYSGLLVDIFYDHLLAKNWNNYSQVSLSEFKEEIYESFINNLDGIPETATQILKQMVDEDWLGSYYNIFGIEKALIRIKKRLSTKHCNDFDVSKAIKQLQDNYNDFNKDFNLFFPDIIEQINQNIN